MIRGVGFVPLTKGFFALVDRADERAVRRHRWQVKIRPRGTAYAVSTIRIGERRRMVSLHRYVWELHNLSVPLVDHKNGWGLDCRTENLREATRMQNAWNASVHRDSASGVKGVTWDKRLRRWRARLTQAGRRVEVARCKRKRDAIAAYRRAARELHGEFARIG